MEHKSDLRSPGHYSEIENEAQGLCTIAARHLSQESSDSDAYLAQKDTADMQREQTRRMKQTNMHDDRGETYVFPIQAHS